MEVKEGYKQTEVGVIPNDWEILKLEQLSSRIGDGIHTTPKYRMDGDYFFVNGNNLVNGRILITEDTKRVSTDEFLIHKRDLDNTTVLISINGTIGNIAFYRNEKIVLGKSAAYINLNKRVNKILFYQLVQTEFIKQYFENELTGSTIKNLGLGAIRNTPIPLPPTIHEQTAIATALSDTDALIYSLEKLIEKKRNIKQGVMQELLTGKKKLDGYSGDWVSKKLKDLVIFRNGKAHELFITESGNFIVVNSKFISSNGEVKKYTDNALYKPNKDEILMVMSDVPNGKAIAKCFLVDDSEKYTVNQRICSLEPIHSDSKLLFYLLNRNPYYLAFDDGVKQTNLRKEDVLNCELNLPSQIDEQVAISSTITAFENEINSLEQKLNKFRMIKQGMMQVLLTGKIRLV